MSERNIKIWTWVARAVTLLAVLAGITAAAQRVPVEVRDYAAFVVSMMGAFSAWIYSFLPGGKPKAKP